MALDDLEVFLAVVQAGGFRDAARRLGSSPSTVSERIGRLESRLDLRLFNRSTRAVTPTEAGALLAARLAPALAEVDAALASAGGTPDSPRGLLRLNVPGAVTRDILPPLLARLMRTHPGIRVELVVEDSFVDAIAAGCDAGIRYGEALARDMISVPIGPRVQWAGAAAAPSYLERRGTPAHPRDLDGHDFIRFRFPSGLQIPLEFEKDGETIVTSPEARLVIGTGATEAALAAAADGVGIVYTFANWLQPEIDAGRLVPVLRDWWPSFEGPRLYYPGRRLVPPPLRAFIDLARDAGAPVSRPGSPGRPSTGP